MLQEVTWNRVSYWRDNGVSCKWGKRNGAPVMYIKPGHSSDYFLLTKTYLEIITQSIRSGETVKNAVDGAYGCCDIFKL